MLLGLVTAVGGGMVRDIAVGRLPAIFGGNTLYATGALVRATEMVVLYELGQQSLGLGVSIVTSGSIALIARRRGWGLPGPIELKLGSLTEIHWRHTSRHPRGHDGSG